MPGLPENMDAYRPALRGRRHMVAAGHYLAAQAGFQVLEAGGNAIDAGVAAGLALGVVQSDLVNVAGVAPIIMYLADAREVVTISGLGCWPKAAPRSCSKIRSTRPERRRTCPFWSICSAQSSASLSAWTGRRRN